jgi:uncharacterized protein (TIGR03437 family)
MAFAIMKLRAAALLLPLAMLPRLSTATVFTPVAIPANNNIQTALYSSFPTGAFTASNTLGTTFNIPTTPGTCGPSGNAPCNFYDGFGTSGSGQSITINVSIASPTDIYTLMNAYSPPPGVQLATIQFVGTGGASLTFPLIGGQDIRDFFQGAFVNSLTNGITGVNALNAFSCNNPSTCLGGGGTGNVQTGLQGDYVADEQHFSLGLTFAGQTLTQIIITDTNNGSEPILLGITVASEGNPSISVNGVITGSGYGAYPEIAPDTYIEIYGSNLALDTRGWASSDFNGVNAPTALDGSSVTIAGQSAFVNYINPSQINALTPSGIPTGPQPLIVTTSVGVSNTYIVTVNPVEPGLLAPYSFLIDGTQYVVAQFLDGSYALPAGAIAGVTSRPASPGDIIVIYGIGFGPVTPDTPAGQLVNPTATATINANFQISIGGVPATVLYAGVAPYFTGLYQFNVTVPDAPAGDAVPVTFSLGGAASPQTLNIAIQD